MSGGEEALKWGADRLGGHCGNFLDVHGVATDGAGIEEVSDNPSEDYPGIGEDNLLVDAKTVRKVGLGSDGRAGTRRRV